MAPPRDKKTMAFLVNSKDDGKSSLWALKITIVHKCRVTCHYDEIHNYVLIKPKNIYLSTDNSLFITIGSMFNTEEYFFNNAKIFVAIFWLFY